MENERDVIKNIAEKTIFSDKGGSNFISLNSLDIMNLFDLYDQKIFNGEIRKKLSEEGLIIEFRASKRTSGVGGITGYTSKTQPTTFYIDISPNVLNSIFRANKKGLPVAAGVNGVCKDRLGCLLLILEHEIIHLMMMLWNYSSEYNPNFKKRPEEIYGKHGKLFQCLIQRYFGHTRFDHDLGLTDISQGYSPKAGIFQRVKGSGDKQLSPPKAGFQNWSYSCYLDSVLMIMFENISSFWRDNIFKIDVEDLDFGDIKIKEIENRKVLAKDLQEQLIEDFESLHKKGQTIKCKNLRKLLLKVLPDMYENQWIMYNAGYVYTGIVNILPSLQIDVPIQIFRWKSKKSGYVPDTVEYKKMPMLTMWDFMDPLTDIGENDDYEKIRWDLIQSPILVFTNGGAPRVRRFNKKGGEKGYTYIEGEKHKFEVIKDRKFGFTILGGRYELVGVVVLHGISPKEEGGSHYTSYFLSNGKDGNKVWYYYNDIDANIEEIASLPESGVWVEKDGKMPSMYFYRLISRQEDIDSPEINIRKRTTSSSSPIKKEIKKPKTLENEDISYRRLDRPDGHTLVYLKDKTFTKSKIGKFKGLLKTLKFPSSATETKISDNILSWRVPTDKMKIMEKEIVKRIKQTN